MFCLLKTHFSKVKLVKENSDIKGNANSSLLPLRFASEALKATKLVTAEATAVFPSVRLSSNISVGPAMRQSLHGVQSRFTPKVASDVSQQHLLSTAEILLKREREMVFVGK